MDYKKTTAPGSTITRDVTDFSKGVRNIGAQLFIGTSYFGKTFSV